MREFLIAIRTEGAQHLFIGDLDDKDDDGELEIGVFDISRAHFMAKAQRELYI